MDLSEKDAARSKWKLSQRHRRGRGRGGPAPRGRQQASGARDLGSNQDRYEEPEVDEHAGPVRKSLGADLAELLERADAYDAGYYFRSRANLLEEYGLPPGDALAYQGLSFDLKGLAACLSLLPRNELLATDAFDEDEQERVEEAGTGQGQPEQQHPAQQAAGQRQQQAAVTSAAPALPQTAAAVATGAIESHKPYTPPLGAYTGGPSQAVPSTGKTISAAAGAVPARPAAAAQQPPSPAPASAAPKPAATATAQQRLAPTAPAPLSQPQPQPQQAAGQEDEELDFLLGLMDIQGPGGAAPVPQPPAAQWPPPLAQPQPAAPIQPLPQQRRQQQQQQPAAGALGGISRIAPPPQQQPKEQSLDEWLDSL